jgi:hypothetical protein
MQTKDIKAELSARASDTLEELDGYRDHSQSWPDFMEDRDLDDYIAEMADGRVSVYTADQLEWLAANCGRADQEEAINCGAKSAQEIAAFCWYSAEREDIAEDIEEIKAAIESLEDESEA